MKGSTSVMATARPHRGACISKGGVSSLRGTMKALRHNASFEDLLNGKCTICSISPDAFDRTDVIPVVALFGGAGEVDRHE